MRHSQMGQTLQFNKVIVTQAQQMTTQQRKQNKCWLWETMATTVSELLTTHIICMTKKLYLKDTLVSGGPWENSHTLVPNILHK